MNIRLALGLISMLKNKFGAKRTNGFPSKLESAVYDMLLKRQMAGEISNIRRQHVVVLQEGSKETKINWKIDFSYTDTRTNETVFVEAKGFRTADYVLKLKMFKKLNFAAIEIWGGSHRYLKLIEKWEPKNVQTQRTAA